MQQGVVLGHEPLEGCLIPGAQPRHDGIVVAHQSRTLRGRVLVGVLELLVRPGLQPGDRVGAEHRESLLVGVLARNWVVWVGLEDERVLICTTTHSMKATHMQHDPRIGLSVIDLDNPYRMASLQGRVVEVRDDEGCQFMDLISIKYTGGRRSRAAVTIASAS
jgi:hypothetical protein